MGKRRRAPRRKGLTNQNISETEGQFTLQGHDGEANINQILHMIKTEPIENQLDVVNQTNCKLDGEISGLNQIESGEQEILINFKQEDDVKILARKRRKRSRWSQGVVPKKKKRRSKDISENSVSLQTPEVTDLDTEIQPLELPTVAIDPDTTTLTFNISTVVADPKTPTQTSKFLPTTSKQQTSSHKKMKPGRPKSVKNKGITIKCSKNEGRAPKSRKKPDLSTQTGETIKSRNTRTKPNKLNYNSNPDKTLLNKSILRPKTKSVKSREPAKMAKTKKPRISTQNLALVEDVSTTIDEPGRRDFEIPKPMTDVETEMERAVSVIMNKEQLDDEIFEDNDALNIVNSLANEFPEEEAMVERPFVGLKTVRNIVEDRELVVVMSKLSQEEIDKWTRRRWVTTPRLLDENFFDSSLIISSSEDSCSTPPEPIDPDFNPYGKITSLTELAYYSSRKRKGKKKTKYTLQIKNVKSLASKSKEINLNENQPEETKKGDKSILEGLLQIPLEPEDGALVATELSTFSKPNFKNDRPIIPKLVLKKKLAKDPAKATPNLPIPILPKENPSQVTLSDPLQNKKAKNQKPKILKKFLVKNSSPQKILPKCSGSKFMALMSLDFLHPKGTEPKKRKAFPTPTTKSVIVENTTLALPSKAENLQSFAKSGEDESTLPLSETQIVNSQQSLLKPAEDDDVQIIACVPKPKPKPVMEIDLTEDSLSSPTKIGYLINKPLDFGLQNPNEALVGQPRVGPQPVKSNATSKARPQASVRPQALVKPQTCIRPLLSNFSSNPSNPLSVVPSKDYSAVVNVYGKILIIPLEALMNQQRNTVIPNALTGLTANPSGSLSVANLIAEQSGLPKQLSQLALSNTLDPSTMKNIVPNSVATISTSLQSQQQSTVIAGPSKENREQISEIHIPDHYPIPADTYDLLKAVSITTSEKEKSSPTVVSSSGLSAITNTGLKSTLSALLNTMSSTIRKARTALPTSSSQTNLSTETVSSVVSTTSALNLVMASSPAQPNSLTSNSIKSLMSLGGLPSTSLGGLPSTSLGGLPSTSLGGLPSTSQGGLPSTSLGGLPSTSLGSLPSASLGGLPSTSLGGLPSTSLGGLPSTSLGGLPLTSLGGLPLTSQGGFPSRSEASPASTSKAGSTPTSKAGPTPTSKAGPTPTSKAGPTCSSKAGPTPTSKAGSTRTSKAGPIRTNKAGQTSTCITTTIVSSSLAKAQTIPPKRAPTTTVMPSTITNPLTTPSISESQNFTSRATTSGVHKGLPLMIPTPGFGKMTNITMPFSLVNLTQKGPGIGILIPTSNSFQNHSPTPLVSLTPTLSTTTTTIASNNEVVTVSKTITTDSGVFGSANTGTTSKSGTISANVVHSVNNTAGQKLIPKFIPRESTVIQPPFLNYSGQSVNSITVNRPGCNSQNFFLSRFRTTPKIISKKSIVAPKLRCPAIPVTVLTPPLNVNLTTTTSSSSENTKVPATFVPVPSYEGSSSRIAILNTNKVQGLPAITSVKDNNVTVLPGTPNPLKIKDSLNTQPKPKPAVIDLTKQPGGVQTNRLKTLLPVTQTVQSAASTLSIIAANISKSDKSIATSNSASAKEQNIGQQRRVVSNFSDSNKEVITIVDNETSNKIINKERLSTFSVVKNILGGAIFNHNLTRQKQQPRMPQSRLRAITPKNPLEISSSNQNLRFTNSTPPKIAQITPHIGLQNPLLARQLQLPLTIQQGPSKPNTEAQMPQTVATNSQGLFQPVQRVPNQDYKQTEPQNSSKPTYFIATNPTTGEPIAVSVSGGACAETSQIVFKATMEGDKRVLQPFLIPANSNSSPQVVVEEQRFIIPPKQPQTANTERVLSLDEQQKPQEPFTLTNSVHQPTPTSNSPSVGSSPTIKRQLNESRIITTKTPNVISNPHTSELPIKITSVFSTRSINYENPDYQTINNLNPPLKQDSELDNALKKLSMRGIQLSYSPNENNEPILEPKIKIPAGLSITCREEPMD